jgi:surfactin synthase thioesterase subunit/glycosyltransferase involved in cell wall biosynthesis
MRILLASSASYNPPKGGSTRSNLVWLRALAAAGHECHVVCGAAEETQSGPVTVDGIQLERYANLSRQPGPIRAAVDRLAPDFVLVSSEDLSHTILREAYRAAPARLVYLAHTPQWFPFGPEAWHQDTEAAAILRDALAIVAIGHHMANYIAEHLGRAPEVIHPALYGSEPWPDYTNRSGGKITLINPCQVKGLPVFLTLAERFPELEFLALRGWGTTAEDLAALRALGNVEVAEPVADIEEIFSRTRVLLAPSLWYEGYGLVATEAYLRGIPVLAADYGGLAESAASSNLRCPVVALREWSSRHDSTGMPVAALEPQPIDAWARALSTIISDTKVYESERAAGQAAARAFARQWQPGDLGQFLARLQPKRRRILLVHNSTYFPASGGGDKSNRLLLEALHREGHTVEVFTRLEGFSEEAHLGYRRVLAGYGIVTKPHANGLEFVLGGVKVHAITRETNLRQAFRAALEAFAPDVILASTDDPAHLFLDIALAHETARVVFLVRATVALPFGPDASTQNSERTARLHRADAIVGVSHYVAQYCHTYANLNAVHVPISLADDPAPPYVGRHENPYVTLVNPSGVKGLPILLGLADAMPQVQFAAVPSWGTTGEDLAALHARPNMTLLGRADDITDILRQTRVTLVPSLWAEARSRVVLESLARGVPVLASDVGGLREAMCGVEYVLPIHPITQYKDRVSEQMAPEAIVPPQDITFWRIALDRLTSDENHWRDLSQRGRAAALDYIATLSPRPLEFIFDRTLAHPKQAFRHHAAANHHLSPARRQLLHLRVQRRLASKRDQFLPVFWGDPAARPNLILFPWAGAGGLSWRFLEEHLRPYFAVWPVVLPQREVRPPYLAGQDLPALARSIAQELSAKASPDQPLLFFGHSMGAAIAWECAQHFHRPIDALFASSCRAPQLRLSLPPVAIPSLQNRTALDADLALFDAYRPTSVRPITAPIHAFCGSHEPNLPVAHVEAWAELSSSGFQLHSFSGDHFWLRQHSAALANLLAETISQIGTRA